MTIKLHFDFPHRRISFDMDTFSEAEKQKALASLYLHDPFDCGFDIIKFETVNGLTVVKLDNLISISVERLED